MKSQTTNQLLLAILSHIDYALLSKKDKLHLQAMSAVNDIVSFETLPPQIDYRVPQERKADESREFLETLPNAKKYYAIIRKRINDYHTPTENGYSVAEMDAMF